MKQEKRQWPAVAEAPPAMTDRQWYLPSLLGVIFLVAAVLQIISFQDFSNNFGAFGLGKSNVWAGAVILAEIWAAAGFFKIRLSRLFRAVSNFLAVLAASFWFYEIVRQASEGIGTTSSNLFGKYLHQTAAWWTVIEVSLFLFLVLYCLEILGGRAADRLSAITRITRRSGKKELNA